MLGTFAFAFAAGMLSTVNPCGFAMLPAFLAYYIGRDEPGAQQSLVRRALVGLGAGLLVSAGFAEVLSVAGLLVALGMRSLIGAVPWVAVLVGVLLVGLGTALLAGRHVGFTMNSSRIARQGRGPSAMLAFGAAYGVASLSCTLAVLLAVIGQALAAGSAVGLVVVFAAYAAGAAMVLVLLALSSALASGLLARILHRTARYVPRIAGAVLLLSGIYLVAYWAPALVAGGANESLATTGSRISSAMTAFLSSNIGLVTGSALAAVAVILISAILVRARNRSRNTVTADDDEPRSR
ncbi:cytochrome c biogenesis CcdA family protein [Leifsonia aquatica]|uniref:Cytochrome c biogenesis protein CcdA n=1 Tax=Leifsonia aquatica TaxID=144185 RepID=A0A7W4UVZ1_LEIAQ|nr:cytochrome c biogenesis protein CcdA [Leifsonia aquatica]